MGLRAMSRSGPSFRRGSSMSPSPKGDEPMVYELTLPELPAGATEKLDPLVADAVLGGTQQCMVTAPQRRCSF